MSRSNVDILTREFLSGKISSMDAFNVRDLARNLDVDVLEGAVNTVQDRLLDWLSDNRDIFGVMDQFKVRALAEDIVRNALKTRWDHSKLGDVIQRHVDLIDLSR